MQVDEISSKRFAELGFMVYRGLVPPDICRGMADLARAALDPLQGPAEFEAEVGYPGSPVSREVPGGDTPRRLLAAFSRHEQLREFGLSPQVHAALESMMGTRDISLSQCHHNCIMTKHPGYSSSTSWHQDIRYWSFDRPELVSVWLALGDEFQANGGLRVIPGSHRLDLDRGRLDRDLFLRPELPANNRLIESAEDVILEPGDVLFFHCRLFHAALNNRTDRLKLSLVYTYHAQDNLPIPGTRSSLYPSVPFPGTEG